MTLRIHVRSAKSLFGVVLLALPLMGFDNPGCTSSRFPLTDREEGFADPSVVGVWGHWEVPGFAELSEDESLEAMDEDEQTDFLLDYMLDPRFQRDDLIFTLALKIDYDESGNLRLIRYKEGEVDQILTGYTSIIDGKRYLNLAPLSCPGCTAERQALIEQCDCRYMIVQYRFGRQRDSDFLPPQFDERLDQVYEKYDLQVILYSPMTNEFVAEAIENGLIAGKPVCLQCFWSSDAGNDNEGACIQSTQEELQQFVKDHDAELYDEWREYVRITGSAAE